MPDIDKEEYVRCRHCNVLMSYSEARTDNGVHFCRKCYIKMYGIMGERNDSAKYNADPHCDGCMWLQKEEWLKNTCAHVCKSPKTPTRNRIIGNPGPRAMIDADHPERPKWCPGKENKT